MNGRGSWKLRAEAEMRASIGRQSVQRATFEAHRAGVVVEVPQMQLTSVLLPDPFGPIRPRRSPCATSRSMPSSATKPPNRFPRP